MFQQLNGDVQIKITINIIITCCIMTQYFATFYILAIYLLLL